MSSSINTLLTPAPPVVVDFGWYYGSIASPQRLSEASYRVGSDSYPPGSTVTAGGANQTLPSGSPIIVASTATLEPSGQVTFYGGTTQHTTCQYTVVDATHIQCTGGSGTFATGTPVYDPRFYVDQMPLQQEIIFDAIDANGLGLPTVQVPSNLTIIYFQWDFGNGQFGFGPYTTVNYAYNRPVSSIQATLTVFDSLGRRFSTAHHLNQRSLTQVFGSVNRVNP